MVHPVVTHMLVAPVTAPFLADVRVLPPRGLNTSGYLDLNSFARQTAWAHAFMHAYALWLGPVLLAAVFLAVYGVAWWRRASRAASLLVLGGIGTVVALGLNQLVAHAARELRPYDTYHHALVLVAKAHDYSFPSDHSVVAGGLTVSVLLVLGRSAWQRRGQAAGGEAAGGQAAQAGARPGVPGVVQVLAAVNVVLGLFLCFARVYVGAHYPGDVVAGYLLSSVVVLAVSLLRPVAFRLVDAVEPTALGAVLRRPWTPPAGPVPAPEPLHRPTSGEVHREGAG